MNDGLGEGIRGLAQALGRAFVPVEAALRTIRIDNFRVSIVCEETLDD